MSDLSAFLNEQMNNPEFAQEYNAVQPEMDAIRSKMCIRDRTLVDSPSLSS